MLALNNLPQDMSLDLFTGSDFYGVLTAAWPAGTSVKLQFETLSPWVATVSGSFATFDIPYTVADVIPDGEEIQLWYYNGATQQCLAKGIVRRHA